jgi:cytochrome b561
MSNSSAHSLKDTPEKYAPLVIALHWLVLALMVAAYVSMEFRDVFERGSAGRDLMKASHYVIGLTILLLATARLVAHVAFAAPAILPPPPLWQSLAAKAMHVALFALMIVLPIVGWLILSAEGEPPVFFGIALPALIGPDRDLAETFEEVHETIATLGYGLIGFHAAAALYHHYVVRDNTLRRMLPGRSAA